MCVAYFEHATMFEEKKSTELLLREGLTHIEYTCQCNSAAHMIPGLNSCSIAPRMQ